jgi:hypothetical protein
MIKEIQEHDVMFCFGAVLAKRVIDGGGGEVVMFYISPVNSSNTAVESGKIY